MPFQYLIPVEVVLETPTCELKIYVNVFLQKRNMLNTWNEAYIKRADDTLKRVLGSDLIIVIENVINTIYEMISITCYLVNSQNFTKTQTRDGTATMVWKWLCVQICLMMKQLNLNSNSQQSV